MGNTPRQFFQLFDARLGVVGILAIASTHACLQNNILVEMPMDLAGIAIFFPIVFSIGQAFKRRERALSELAEFSAPLSSSASAGFIDLVMSPKPRLSGP